MTRRNVRVWMTASLVTASVTAPAAQTTDFLAGSAAVTSIVRGAPYSGEGVTTMRQILRDGTRIERSTPSKFYRDSAGRVRREQTILGLASLNPARDSQEVVTIVDPVAGVTYVLTPHTRVARRTPISKRVVAERTGLRPPPPPPPPPRPPGGPAASPSAPPPPPPAPRQPHEESLGVRQIHGIAAIGHRTRFTIPTGQIGNDRPIEITDERWESPDLKVIVHSRHRDPRTGVVEYRLTNVRRDEPPQDLFSVPSDYTIVDGPPLPPPPPPPNR